MPMAGHPNANESLAWFPLSPLLHPADILGPGHLHYRRITFPFLKLSSMGGSKTINRPIFERRRKEHNIVFADECPPAQWPDDQREVFEAIEKLKGFRYGTYAVQQDSDADVAATPWKAEAKCQARLLVAKVKDLVSRNEPTWRSACEPLVFSRLAAEVACKRCRRRVWRSEIEALLNTRDSASSNLRARQENRDRCRCPITTRPDDEDEKVGLNRLFIDRSEDMVIHPPDLERQLPQAQRPDRVYGLRQTRNIEGLMLKRLSDDAFLEDLLHKQPHSTLGEALLFPFLVVEAKSGTASDDWHSIRLQTAFPIYTYLNTQQSLRLATAQKSKWTSGPLVWFFMSKGDDWRVCLAYQSPVRTPQSSSCPGHTTNIVTVWAGCISNRDDALQLFLIVDYMSDWARDVYRAAVIRELRILSAPDMEIATVFTDTDIFSSRHMVLDPSIAVLEDPITISEHDHRNPQAAFKQLESALGGVVRHAAPIECRFRALFLTMDNIQTFVSSTSNNIRQYFIRQILRQFSPDTGRPVALTPDQISSIEENWTGYSRLRAPFHLKDTKFYTVHVVTYHLLPSWDQARDLCLIAVQEQAFDDLVVQSKLKTAKGRPYVEPGSLVLDEIARLKSASVEQNLLACISRTCGRIELQTLRRSDNRRPSITKTSFQTCPSTIWLLLSYTYKFHKKGDLEPDLPFLRISASSEIQRAGIQNLNDPLAPTGGRGLHVSDQGAVLINGSTHHHFSDASRSPICVYLVRDSTEPPNQDELARIIKRTFEDHDVYHTTRNYGTLSIRDMKECRSIWNLSHTYGVFFSGGGSSFVKWLKALGKPLPTRQGSPRGPRDTGRIMFTREYQPWNDPRIMYGLDRDIQKKFFKRLFVAEVTAWARIAQERIWQGNDCCPLCATFDPERSHDGSKDDSIPTPSCSSPNESQEDDPASTSELDHSSPESESSEAPARTSLRTELADGRIVKDLCTSCASNVSEHGTWPAWLKKVIRKVLREVVSTSMPDDAPASDAQDGYCISTPRRRSIRTYMRRRSHRVKGSPADEQSSPSDSASETDDADVCSDGIPDELPQGDVKSHVAVNGENGQADGATNSTLGVTSPRQAKRTLSSRSGDEAARKRRKRSVSQG
ncbi:hypothetical protein VTI74DRAFT_11257 [Chaetomium olivicolor]